MRKRVVAILALVVAVGVSVSGREARAVPNVYNVADGDVTDLIAAIVASNANPGPDTINLAANGTYTLTAAYDGDNGLPPISGELLLNGSGAIIERSNAPGTPDFRIVTVSGGPVTFEALTIANGRSSLGGGILNFGSLALMASTVELSAASLYGGGIYNWPGATLSVLSSSIVSNSADTFIPSGCHSCSYGGGINNWGTLVVANSTVAHNSTGFSGGGIYSNGSVVIINSTVAGNLSMNFAGGIAKDSGGTMSAVNTIVAGNLSTSIGQTNCFAVGSGFGSLGHNLSDDGTCTAFFSQPGDLNHTPAGLDPAGARNNGGSTATIALVAGSAAIDAGDNSVCTASPVSGLDQRGVTRPIGSHCDIGAFEAPAADAAAPTLVCSAADGLWHAADVTIVCSASDSGSGLADPGDASFVLATSVAPGTETADAYTNSRVVCDNAGNCATAGPIGGNKVDKLGPAITLLTPVSTNYILNQTVTASFGCADAGSGVGACTGTVADGASVDTASPGSHTFTVTATDIAGNSTTITRTYSVGYNVCVLFDQNKAYKSGSTLPLKLQLCDSSGANVSQTTVSLTATGAYLISTNAPGPLEDSGNANPDYQFRFDVDKYIFNLSLKGFGQGTYALTFTAGTDPTTHVVQFQVK